MADDEMPGARPGSPSGPLAGSPPGRIRAVVFDMDGVLVDARDWHFEALNRALAPHGRAISRDDHLARFDGLPTATKLTMLSVESGLPMSAHAGIAAAKQRYTLAIARARCRPVGARVRTLQGLRRRGFALAVASNAVRASVVLMLHLSGLLDEVELILSNEDVSRPKPDPAIFLAAMAGLGVGPGETLIVEDSVVGRAAARASGAHVLAVQGPDDITPARLDAALATLQPAARAMELA